MEGHGGTCCTPSAHMAGKASRDIRDHQRHFELLVAGLRRLLLVGNGRSGGRFIEAASIRTD